MSYKVNGNVIEVEEWKKQALCASEINRLDLPKEECKRLHQIVALGYNNATHKDVYLEDILELTTEWEAASRREYINVVPNSRFSDFWNPYNNTRQKPLDQHNEGADFGMFRSAMSFYLLFGAITLALSCIFMTLFIVGLRMTYFAFNPFIMLMLVVGFLGLFATDVAALVVWRRGIDG